MPTAYKDWWSKVTINDLRTNVSFLEKITETNSSRCKKMMKSVLQGRSREKKVRLLWMTWIARRLSLMALFESLPASVLLRRNRALETGVTVSMIPRKTSDLEGARGVRL